MGTSWTNVIAEDAMLLMNDVRLDEDLAENPALFFRRMSFYMKSAIPRFNRPPEIKEWLAIDHEPTFDDYACDLGYYGETEDEIKIETGKTGYELVSVGMIEEDKFGNPVYSRVNSAAYDEETGVITIPGGDIVLTKGAKLSVDFYNDGAFVNDLTYEQRRILGMCMQYVWETNFVNDWLNRAPRASDKTFNAGNVANQTRVNTDRVNSVKKTLDTEIAAYAQNCEYIEAISNDRRIKSVY